MICMKSALQQKASQNKRKKLDIPWNNAGIGGLSSDTVTKQGIEGHIGVNGVGTLHFTQLLYEKLRAATTSNGEKKNRVRIVWTTSWMGEGRSPKGGYRMEDLERGGTGDGYVDYAVLKTASWMLAYEAGRRWDAEGILSVSVFFALSFRGRSTSRALILINTPFSSSDCTKSR